MGFVHKVQECIKLIVIEFGINVLVFVNDKILDEIFYLNSQRQIFCFGLTTKVLVFPLK